MTPQEHFKAWASACVISGESGLFRAFQRIDGVNLMMELSYIADIKPGTHFPGDHESPPEDDSRCLSVHIYDYEITYDGEYFEVTDEDFREIEEAMRKEY